MTDPAIAPVYEPLGALRPGDFARRLGSRPLGRMHRSGPLRTRAAHRPAVLVPDDVLIAFCHDVDQPFWVYEFHTHDNM